LNRQRSFIAVLSTSKKKKKPTVYFHFLLRCLYWQLKNEDGGPWNNSFWNRVTETKKFKGTVLWYILVLYWKLYINTLTSLNAKVVFMSDDVTERQSSPHSGQNLLSFFAALRKQNTQQWLHLGRYINWYKNTNERVFLFHCT